MKSSRSQRPAAHIEARLKTLREHLARNKLSVFLVNNPVDQFYLTGFTGEDGVVLVAPDKVYLITDGRFTEQAGREAGWARAIIRKGAISEAISKLRKQNRWRRIAFQPEYTTVVAANTYRKVLRPAELVKGGDVIREMRKCKDRQEIKSIREAIRIAEEAFKATCRAIRVGMTEKHVAARLEYEMLKRGSSEAAFQTIVAEGPNASLPHYRAGNRKIRPGSLILIDWGATVGNYHSDLTRVLFVRRIPPRFRRMYTAVLEAQRRAVAAVRPDALTSDVDGAARRYLTSVGYGKAFVHATGHGLGLDIHETPSLSRRTSEPLRSGMVVTVEPGVYLPGTGGVRIEDDILVTPKGGEVLSTLSAEPADMVIRG